MKLEDALELMGEAGGGFFDGDEDGLFGGVNEEGCLVEDGGFLVGLEGECGGLVVDDDDDDDDFLVGWEETGGLVVLGVDDENGFLGVGIFGGLVVLLDDEQFLLEVDDEDGF